MQTTNASPDYNILYVILIIKIISLGAASCALAVIITAHITLADALNQIMKT